MAITAAGTGSAGIDLESVIAASVAAKKAQLQQPIIKKQNSTQIAISGIDPSEILSITLLTFLIH